MGHTPEALARHPNPLAAHYRRFRVGERLLLTGHSHQAWPDCGFEGQLRAWLDAAEWVDDKWARAFEQADAVRRGFARLLDDPGSDIALGASTHELLLRFLSALPLARRPRLVTTDGEFHTIRRQLDRLAEEGIEVVRVPAEPADDAAERLAAAADDRTAAALVSSVFFGSGRIVPGLGVLAERCRRVGAALLVDAYHSLNVVPFSVRAEGLADAFVVGGGYKYCQLGEGNCFLRLPPGCRLRPVVTGWFAEFAALDRAPEAGVGYGEGAARFAGSTYDPVSHYRAAAVFDFFVREGLDPALLRAVSRRQVGLLAARFDALALDPAVIVRDRAVPLEALGGFLVLRAPAAADICRRLKAAGVWADSRGEALRLGPAPYLSDPQLEAAVAVLGEVIRSS
ncbi:MAG TPA: kynureninase [Acidobacteriota bacterium]|nr:kynureninase [Acidobacteriota bacterium]